MYRRLTLRDFEVVLAIAETGSTRAASERLHIAQPSVSRTLRNLEERLGVSLFTRSATGMALTASGDEFVSRAYEIILRVEDTSEFLQKVGKGVAGRIVIGYTDDFQYGWFPSVIRRFLADNPPIETLLELDYSSLIAEKIARGAIDIGVLSTPLPAKLTRLSQHPAPSMDLGLLVAADSPIAERGSARLEDMVDHTVIVGSLDTNSGFYIQMMRILGDVRHRLTFRHGIYPSAMMVNLVADGYGVAPLTPDSVPPGRTDVRLVPFSDRTERIENSLVWRADSVTHPMQRFAKAFNAVLPEQPPLAFPKTS